MKTENYIIKSACSQFNCPLCGKLVKHGDNYVDQDGIRTCPCVLPVRKLIPLSRIKELESLVRHMELQNLKMRLDIEVLSSFPGEEAAKKIINKYIRRRKIFEEQLLSTKN